jgi:hypothetical protein
MTCAGRGEVVSTFRSEGRWAPHTTRSWEFLGFEEGLKGSDWLPSLDKSGGDVIVGVLDSGTVSERTFCRCKYVLSHNVVHLPCSFYRDLAGVKELQRRRARAGSGAVEGSVPGRRFLQPLVVQ